MTYTDSEITRLFAEAVVSPGDRYRIREEIRWLVNNSPELDKWSRDFYTKFFSFEEGTAYTETLQ